MLRQNINSKGWISLYFCLTVWKIRYDNILPFGNNLFFVGRISFDSTVTCPAIQMNEMFCIKTRPYTSVSVKCYLSHWYIYVFVYKLSYIMTTYIYTRTYTHCISQTISAGEETSNSYKGNICLNWPPISTND